jgi:hypothetical protein
MTLESALSEIINDLNTDKAELLDALESVTSQLEAITNDYDYPHEVLIARVEKAKGVNAKFERFGDMSDGNI